MSKYISKSKTDSIQNQPEKKPSKKIADQEPTDTRDIDTIIHELRVHQVELEAQNEALRNAQAEILESQNRYADFYDFSPVGYLTLDGNSLILELNLTAAELLGDDRQSLRGKLFNFFVLPECKQIFYRHRHKVLNSAGKQTCDLVLRKRDGTPFHGHLESIAVTKEGNRVIRSVLTDTTAVELFHKTEQRLSSILAGITDCHYELDRNFCFTLLNDQCLTYFNRKKDEFIGRSYWDVFPALKSSIYNEQFNEAISKSTSVHFDVASILYPGKWIEFHAYPTEDGGISAFFRDVTDRKLAEEDIARLASFPELNPNPIIEINSSGEVTFFNKAAQKALLDLNMGKQDLKAFVPEDLGAVIRNGHEKEKSSIVRKIPIKDRVFSESIYLSSRYNVIRIYATDVTELKQAEEAAWVASQNLQSILINAKGFFIYQAVPDETYSYRARVLMVSPSVTDVSGITDVYNFGAWFENIHPDDLPRIVEANRHSIETHEAFDEVMRWYHRLHNEWIWIHVISNPVYDQLGRIIHFNGLFIDITAQKKAEEALKHERDLLQTIMDSAGKAQIVYLDRDFNFVRVNETYATGCGCRPEEMIGKNHFALYPNPEVEAIFSHVRDTGEDFEVHDRPFEYPDQPERGVTYWDWTLKAIKDPGDQVAGLVFSLYDTTERKRAEDELRAAHDELEFRVQERTAQLRKQADLLDLAHDAVILSNKEDTISFWNKGAEETYGFTREEAVGKSLHALLQTKSDIPLKDIMGSVVNEGRWDGELVHTRKDGDKVTVHSRWVLRHDEATGSSEIMEVNRDITPRKRAEKALAMISAYNRSLIETSIDPLATINSQGMISDVNIATERVTGYPRDKLIGTDFCDYFTDPTKAKAVYEQVFREKTVRNYELEILHKDGRTTPVLYNASVYRNEAGKVVGVLAAARDVTELRYMEQILRESEERYRTAIESASDGVALMRGDQHIYVNKRFAEMFGYSSPSEILGKSLSLTVHPDDLAMVSEINMMRQNGEPVPSRYEFRGIRKDGTLRNIEVSATMINYLGERASLVYLRDITDYKNLEEQLRQSHKMEAIGTLAGGIAHDFNNILAGIIGFAEMVEDDLPPDSPSIHRIQRVLKAAYRGKDLVQQILTFSRKSELTRTPVSLSLVTRETADLLRASLPATIEINVFIKAARDTILANSAEIQQILMNLATNAAFAMRETGGILGIGLTDIDFEPNFPLLDEDVEPGAYVQLAVTDTGIGMEPHIIKRLFEPYFTTKEVGQGTGMGLPVVYGIVKGLGGTIAVESERGIGSTFRVFLPAACTVEATKTGDTQTVAKGSERILFIDDEDLIMEWGQAALERLGYTVTALTDSTEALKLFSSDPSRFDLIITDQTMPKLTGLNLAKKLLKIRPDIRIILCTGHSDSVSPEKAKEAGIKEFLMKPLGRKKLAGVVRRVFGTTESEGKPAYGNDLKAR